MKNKCYNWLKNFALCVLLSPGFSIIKAQVPIGPNLLNFSFFTSTGAFTNTGGSLISDDIGSHVGAITGFPPGITYGTQHSANAITALAFNETDSLYNYLFSQTCGTVLGNTLGLNQTIYPGVHCIGNASTLSGDLYFNAGGNVNAIFIIQIDGALDVFANSNIILEDSARVKNIYWQINGAFSAADSAIFQGIIVGNGSISFANKSRLIGRAFTRAGAINLDNIETISIEGIPLPINLYDFKVQSTLNGTAVLVTWRTGALVADIKFEVEHSQNGKNFKSIGTIKGLESTQLLGVYKYIHYNPNGGVNFYRIMEIGPDGKFYSETLAMHTIIQNNGIKIYPNPFSDQLNVECITGTDLGHNITLFNTNGIMVYTQSLSTFKNHLNLVDLPNGAFQYRVYNQDGEIQSGILIKIPN